MAKDKIDQKTTYIFGSVSILAVLLLIFLTMQNYEIKNICETLKATLEITNNRLLLMEIESGGVIVDPWSPNAQPIGGNFQVGELSMNPYLTGVKVSGRIINSSDMKYEAAEFEIAVAGQKQRIMLYNLVSKNCRLGEAKKYSMFEVYIPDVPIEKAHYLRINYVAGRT